MEITPERIIITIILLFTAIILIKKGISCLFKIAIIAILAGCIYYFLHL